MTQKDIELQIDKLVDTLRRSNKEEERKGTQPLPDTEYAQLKSILVRKLSRKHRILATS